MVVAALVVGVLALVVAVFAVVDGRRSAAMATAAAEHAAEHAESVTASGAPPGQPLAIDNRRDAVMWRLRRLPGKYDQYVLQNISDGEKLFDVHVRAHNGAVYLQQGHDFEPGESMEFTASVNIEDRAVTVTWRRSRHADAVETAMTFPGYDQRTGEPLED